MDAGTLRERLQIQRHTLIDQGGGGSSVAWVEQRTVWGRVQPLEGREQIQAMGLAPTGMYQVTIRYRDDVKPATDRLFWKDMILNIRTATNPDERRQWLEMMCEAGVAT